MERKTLSRKERIKNSNEISTLIREGQAFFLHPFKVYYILGTDSSKFESRVAFSVPKKKFSKASDRNRLKRIMRESYRLQKELLHTHLANKSQKIDLVFIYQQTKFLTTQEIFESIGHCILKITKNG